METMEQKSFTKVDSTAILNCVDQILDVSISFGKNLLVNVCFMLCFVCQITTFSLLPFIYNIAWIKIFEARVYIPGIRNNHYM